MQVHRVGRPHSITIIPNELTLVVGQSHGPQLVDNYGRTISDADWSSDNPSVVSIGDDQKTVTGKSLGNSTVTARWRTLTTSMKLRVLPGGLPLPHWTVEWGIVQLPGYHHNPLMEPIRPLQVDADTPKMITIEHEIAGTRTMLRAFDGEPRQLWIEAPAISAREQIGAPHVGDDMGGGLLRVETADGRSNSIVRVGRPSHGTLWRYTPAGRLGEEFANYDGTVDVVETPPDGFPMLVGIDGMTGSAKLRIPLPRSSFTALNVACLEGANARRDRPADVGLTPTVLDNGIVTLAVSTVDTVEDALPCGRATTRRSRTIQMMRVSLEGRATYRTVYEYPPSSGDRVDVVLTKVLPDGHDGQLVAWSAQIGQQPVDYMVVRVIGERLIPFHLPALGVTVLGEQDLGVTTDGRTIVGFDVTNGDVLWTHRATPNGSFRILLAVAGGGVQVATARGLEHIDRAGRRVLLGERSR